VGHDTSHQLIVQLHQEVVKSPFPEEMERLFNRYDYWREKYTKREFAEHLDVLEPLLKNHQSIDSYTLVACRVCWLLGHIYFDRAFYLKTGKKLKLAEIASEWYQQALAVLFHHKDRQLVVQEYKLQQCLVSTQFNCYKPGQRAENQAIQSWLKAINYIQLVESVIQEDSWNWVAARNGLVAASILKDFEKCLFFWQAMQHVNKQFADLAFVPSNDLPALNRDLDVVWFLKQLSQAGA
jgi:glutathione S-transferase